jgi:RNA polymerase sigma factor (sigma-70 family)
LQIPNNSAGTTLSLKDQRRIESAKEDHRLIRKALEGCQESYGKIMRKYQDSVRNIIFKIIHDQDELDDLVQETFIKAFSSLKSFNEQYSFATWIYKIATNNCIDHLRKRKLKTLSINRTYEQEDRETSFDLPDKDAEADKMLIEDQKKKIIRDAIDSLPEKYKTVIIMRHQEEKNYDEISQALDIPIGTVKAHIFRAREMLNKYLKEKRFMM